MCVELVSVTDDSWCYGKHFTIARTLEIVHTFIANLASGKDWDGPLEWNTGMTFAPLPVYLMELAIVR